MVVTDVGGNAEAVSDGKSGIAVRARDVSALRAAILSLADDTDLRQRMGATGKARVAEEFSLEESTARCLTLYGDLLAKKAPRGRSARMLPSAVS